MPPRRCGGRSTSSPSDAEAHYYLGEALNQAGDYAGARTALEQSAALDPDSAKTYRLLGRVLDRLGRPGRGQGDVQPRP